MLLGVSLKGLGRWEGLLVAEAPLGGTHGQTLTPLWEGVK